jgi:methyl-accepting chemotaxis protein
MNNYEIEQMLESYDKEVKRLKQHMSKLSWYMRGGVNYEQLMSMSLSDIENFTEVIDDNIELSKKAKQLIL